MSTECKDEIDRDQARSSEDYRLNYKLAEACKRDTDMLCPNLCQKHQACGGQVLRCLTDKSDQISAKACRDEVFYFKKMEVTDFRNDVLLAAACRDDVDEFCSKVKPGRSPVALRLSVTPESDPKGEFCAALLFYITQGFCLPAYVCLFVAELYERANYFTASQQCHCIRMKLPNTVCMIQPTVTTWWPRCVFTHLSVSCLGVVQDSAPHSS